MSSATMPCRTSGYPARSIGRVGSTDDLAPAALRVQGSTARPDFAQRNHTAYKVGSEPPPGAACQHRVEVLGVSSQDAVDGHIRRLLWECSTAECACDEGRALSVAIQGTTTQEAAGSTPAVPTNAQGRALPYDVPGNQPGREPDGTQTDSNCDTTESHAAQPNV